jgi:hypothetical protein
MTLGKIAHACNPSYLETGDQEDCIPRPAWAKSKQDPISINKSGEVIHLCNVSYLRIVQDQPWAKKHRILFEK